MENHRRLPADCCRQWRRVALSAGFLGEALCLGEELSASVSWQLLTTDNCCSVGWWLLTVQNPRIVSRISWRGSFIWRRIVSECWLTIVNSAESSHCQMVSWEGLFPLGKNCRWVSTDSDDRILLGAWRVSPKIWEIWAGRQSMSQNAGNFQKYLDIFGNRFIAGNIQDIFGVYFWPKKVCCLKFAEISRNLWK